MSLLVWSNGEYAVPSHIVDREGKVTLDPYPVMHFPEEGVNWTVNGRKVLAFANLFHEDISNLPLIKDRLKEGLTLYNAKLPSCDVDARFEVALIDEENMVWDYWNSEVEPGKIKAGLTPSVVTSAHGDGARLAQAVLSIGKGVKKAAEIAIDRDSNLAGKPVIYVLREGKLVLKEDS